MTALEIYKPPFWHDGLYIWSSDNVMALEVSEEYELDTALLDRTCDILNGKAQSKGNPNIVHANGEIFNDRELMFVVRGYGHLTGSGGLALDLDEAILIQDEFAAWICDKLRND